MVNTRATSELFIENCGPFEARFSILAMKKLQEMLQTKLKRASVGQHSAGFR